MDGFILLAYQDFIVYCNVSKYGIDDEEKTDGDLNSKHRQLVEIQIKQEELCFLDLHKRYKIVCI